MKGVILAGGHATRLYPCTSVTNKHLLPVYDKPMIFYPIQTLKDMDIKEILVILGANSVGDIVNLLQDGWDFGVEFSYVYQRDAGGIAQAVGLAKEFVGKDDFAVILGDNIFYSKLICYSAPHIYLIKSKTPERFGCVGFDESLNINKIVEKPSSPPSEYVIPGLYILPSTVFDLIDVLVPSARGELEITDLLKYYLSRGELKYTKLEDESWHDAGTFESLFEATALVREQREVAKGD